MDFENNAGLIEMAFVYTVVLGFGLWQIISIRRQLRRDKEAADLTPPVDPPRT